MVRESGKYFWNNMKNISILLDFTVVEHRTISYLILKYIFVQKKKHNIKALKVFFTWLVKCFILN